jgi:hypothetical protein
MLGAEIMKAILFSPKTRLTQITIFPNVHDLIQSTDFRRPVPGKVRTVILTPSDRETNSVVPDELGMLGAQMNVLRGQGHERRKHVRNDVVLAQLVDRRLRDGRGHANRRHLGNRTARRGQPTKRNHFPTERESMRRQSKKNSIANKKVFHADADVLHSDTRMM